jgi:large subunit ribosomal protein L25
VNDISLKLAARKIEGKKVEKIREDGFVPSVVYGDKYEPISTQSGLVETAKIVAAAGMHTPINLIIDGKSTLAIIKSLDFSPVKHKLRHIAFHKIDANDIIETEVAIVLTDEGNSPAERVGLIILQALETIEVKAKPADLPESIELSVLGMVNVDDRLTVGDIKLPKGVEFADADQDLELVIANVYETSALQAANEAAGGEAEPEDAEEVVSTEVVEAADDNKEVEAKTE